MHSYPAPAQARVQEMVQAAAADPARAVSFQGAPGCNGHRAALEYDPAPPFDAGSPAKAGEALVGVYAERANRLAPTRKADLIASARRLGFATD